MSPEKFGTYTYSQIVAIIDAAKLRNLDDRYFSVMDIVGNMTDDNVRDSLHGAKKPGSAIRDKLIQKMIRPYLPTFMLPEIAQSRKVSPIEGLSPKAAEGIMQAIERKLIPHDQWLGIVGIWQRIHATAKRYRE